MSTPQNQVFVSVALPNVVSVVSPGPQGPTGPMGGPTGPTGPSIGPTGPTGPVGSLTTTPTNTGSLPIPTAGLRAMVTDATSTTFGSVLVGNGVNIVPVYADGAVWRIG